jgi:DNA-binding transcriptional regulator YbjK
MERDYHESSVNEVFLALDGESESTRLEIFWNATDDWTEAEHWNRIDALLVRLTVAHCTTNEIVSVLAATYSVRNHLRERSTWRERARRVLQNRGEPQARIARLLGAE